MKTVATTTIFSKIQLIHEVAADQMCQWHEDWQNSREISRMATQSKWKYLLNWVCAFEYNQYKVIYLEGKNIGHSCRIEDIYPGKQHL